MTDPDPSTADDRLSVLLVEDTLDSALEIRAILDDELRCKVVLAQDGIRGRQLVENQEWDLVVVDLHVPGRDGIEVIAASKEAFPRTPVLATTGSTGIHDAEQGLRAGADEVLVKPLDRDELVETVRALVRRRRQSRQEEPERSAKRCVLAVGALPGDVELGCGGILIGHRAHGHAVGVLVMSAGGGDDEVEARRTEARRAADRVDGRLMLADPFRSAIPTEKAMLAWFEEAVGRFRPDTLYTPSPHDVRDSRLRTYRAAVAAGADIPDHFCYQAATTTLDFEPSLFVDVAEYMDRKLELLEAFRGEPDFRPHLQPYVARASARYWGRFLGYGEVEPLEVVRSSQ